MEMYERICEIETKIKNLEREVEEICEFLTKLVEHGEIKSISRTKRFESLLNALKRGDISALSAWGKIMEVTRHYNEVVIEPTSSLLRNFSTFDVHQNCV